MTDQEIRVGILSICKIKGSDSDINITGFHALCDKLKELGAAAERKACAKVCDKYVDSPSDHEAGAALNIQDEIRARGRS